MSDLLNVVKRELNLSARDIKQKENEGFLKASVYGKNLGSHPVFMNTKETPLNQVRLGSKFRLRWSGKELVATVKEIQKHPSTNRPVHISFHTLSQEDMASNKISLKIVGEAQGEKKGGTIVLLKPHIEVRGKAKNLPEELEVDVTKLNVGDHFMPSDIKLPEGVEFNEAEDFFEQPLAICQAAQKAEEESVSEEPTEIETKTE